MMWPKTSCGVEAGALRRDARRSVWGGKRRLGTGAVADRGTSEKGESLQKKGWCSRTPVCDWVSGAAAPAVRATYRTIEREPFDRAATSGVA